MFRYLYTYLCKTAVKHISGTGTCSTAGWHKGMYCIWSMSLCKTAVKHISSTGTCSTAVCTSTCYWYMFHWHLLLYGTCSTVDCTGKCYWYMFHWWLTQGHTSRTCSIAGLRKDKLLVHALLLVNKLKSTLFINFFCFLRFVSVSFLFRFLSFVSVLLKLLFRFWAKQQNFVS